MKHQKAIRVLSFVVFVVALAISVVIVLFSYSDASCASCVFAFKDEEVVDNVCVFESEEDICRVDVKAATSVYTFTEDGCELGYCVSGVGTKSGVATVDETYKHDISYVAWYVYNDPTPVRIVSLRHLGFISRLVDSIKSLF